MRGDVATKLEISERTLARWEKGDFEPSIATLGKLAEMYGVPLGNLVAGDNAA